MTLRFLLEIWISNKGAIMVLTERCWAKKTLGFWTLSFETLVSLFVGVVKKPNITTSQIRDVLLTAMEYANLKVAVTDIAVKNSLITAPPVLATEVLWNLPAC